jgi:YjjG family noncanonical pyrimidine nucleotidase
LFQHKKHLFFDLDHTLWDFDANAFDCLLEIYQVFGLESNGIIMKEFYDNFTQINRSLWTQLELNQIEHIEIRKKRFKMTLEALELIIGSKVSESMNDTFLELLPQKSKLVDGCVEVLDDLKEKYQLHILSNGYAKIQAKKLRNSGIDSYFDKVITNDIANYRKPEKGIFDYALRKTKSPMSEALMIGDSYLADILGAKNAGWDTIHFTEKEHPDETLSTVKIKKLKDLFLYI